jgi:multiple sugar transport system substrate-binding protein
MKQIQMKHTWVVVVLAMILIFTAACGNTTDEKVELTFWNGFTGPDRPAIEELVKRFNKANPNIQVTMDITPWDTLLAKLPTSWTTGKGPDIAGFNTSLIPKYAKANLILPVDELYKGDLKGVFGEGVVNGLKYNNKVYGVPANFATLMMYYNKDLFKDAGLDPENPPKTWAEWQKAIKATTKTKGSEKQYGLVLADHATIPMWPLLIWGNGGDFISAKGKSMMNDAKTVEAFKIWSDLVINAGISPTGLTGAEADKLFQSGKAAMEMNGPWMTAGYTAAGLNYDVAPIPVGPGGPVTLADSIALVAGKNTKNKEQVLEFMKFWNSKESQEYLSLQTGFPPTRTDMLGSEKLKANPFVLKFAAVSPTARFYLGGLEEYARINDDIIVPAIQEITMGKAAVDAALKSADEKLTKLMGK